MKVLPCILIGRIKGYLQELLSVILQNPFAQSTSNKIKYYGEPETEIPLCYSSSL